MNATLSPAQFKIRDRLLRDVEELPVLPMVATRLVALSPDADDFFERVVEGISQDPGIAVRILAVANSAALKGVVQVKTIPDAVVRLGARAVANLVVAISVTEVLPPRQPFEDGLWRHSFEVAQVARALARTLKERTVHPDELYLAGLLHDMGRFLLGREVSDPMMAAGEGEWSSVAELLETELQSCGVQHPELGALACAQWGVPLEIGRVVRCHHESEAQIPDEFRRTVRALQVADEVVFRIGLIRSPIESIEVKVFGKILETAWPSWSKIDPWDHIEAVREAFVVSRKSARAIGFKF